MKGFIDTDGDLSLMRGPRFVVQLCPFSAGGDYCGDHCSHFGEPVMPDETIRAESPTLIQLSCGRGRDINFSAGGFEDKRGS